MKSEKIYYKYALLILVLVFATSSSTLIINDTFDNHLSDQQKIQSAAIPNKSPNDWTFLVYLDADNNLEQDGIIDFLEMASVGSDSNIHIVVQFDRTPGYDTSFDDWEDTKIFHIDPGETPTIANADVHLGEINMGLSSSLSDFITWGTFNYPSDHYALILWNHGSGWKSDDETPDPLFKGVCYDDTDGDYLDNTELQNALVTADVYFDLIAFDACLMAMVEIDYQIKDWAQIRVASEEVVPLDGFPYDTILGHLQADPTMAAWDLGIIMVNDYINYYGTGGIETLSAVDLTQEGTLATAIDTLSSELITEIVTYYNEIKDSRAASEASFYDPDYIDLYDFVYEINNRIPDIDIQNAAQDVMLTLLPMTINEAHGSSHPDFRGTSIYYPTSLGGYNPAYETSLDFTAALSWDEFLQAYYSNFVDDNYEENDDYTTAYDLSLYEDTWLSLIDGLGIQADDDWYEIYVDPGYEFLQVTLTFSNAAGDIDIEVYDSTLTYIDGSWSVTDNEYISILVPSAGTYYLLIYFADAGNAYDLWWDDTLAPSDDNYEENDDDTTAYDLSGHENTWLSSIDGLGIQYDYDWYEIYVDPGDLNLLVTLIFTHADGNMDIGVYDSGLSLLTYTTSTTDNEYIDYVVLSSGTYYLLILGEDRGNTYDLWWDDTPGVPPPDDNYEENDDPGSAYDLSSDEATWLSAINGTGFQLDNDWYEIYVDPGDEHLLVTLLFTHADGDIEIDIVNETMSWWIGNYSVTDNEYIDYVLPWSGVYYIVVYGENAGNEYDLWWDDLSSTDDNYEENDDLDSAYDLSGDEDTLLSTVDGFGVQLDDDWYQISIAPGYEQLIVDLTFDHTADNLDLGIYDSTGTLVTESTSSTDDEHIDYVLPSSGTYYIRVDGNDIGNEYDLRWNSIIPDDNYEENDDLDSAYDLSGDEDTLLNTIDGFGVQLDDDWYEISIDSGYENVTIVLNFTHSAGNINLALYNSTGDLITSSASTTDNEFLNYVVSSSGTYYIRVYGDNAGNSYNLIWSSIEYTPPSGTPAIPGYDLLFLFGVIITISAIAIIKIGKRKLKLQQNIN